MSVWETKKKRIGKKRKPVVYSLLVKIKTQEVHENYSNENYIFLLYLYAKERKSYSVGK